LAQAARKADFEVLENEIVREINLTKTNPVAYAFGCGASGSTIWGHSGDGHARFPSGMKGGLWP